MQITTNLGQGISIDFVPFPSNICQPIGVADPISKRGRGKSPTQSSRGIHTKAKYSSTQIFLLKTSGKFWDPSKPHKETHKSRSHWAGGLSYCHRMTHFHRGINLTMGIRDPKLEVPKRVKHLSFHAFPFVLS